MDAFNTLKAKIKRRLELEKQVRAIVLEIRLVDKVLKVEEEYTDLCKSLGKTMAARLKRNPDLTGWDKMLTPSTSERKRALERLYDQSYKKKPQSAEDANWSDYLHEHLVRVDKRRHQEISARAGAVTDKATKALADSEKNRLAAIDLTARMEKLVEEEMEFASQPFERKPLFDNHFAQLETKIRATEESAKESKKQIQDLLKKSSKTFLKTKSPQSKKEMETLTRELAIIYMCLDRSDPEEREFAKNINLLVDHWRSKFYDDDKNTTDEEREERRLRNKLGRDLSHCMHKIHGKDRVERKISWLFAIIRQIKAQRDTLALNMTANFGTVAMADAFLEQCVQTLEEIVKLRGEWEKLKSEASQLQILMQKSEHVSPLD